MSQRREDERGYARRASELRESIAALTEGPARAEALHEYGDASRFAGRIGESEDAFRELLAGATDARGRCVAHIGLGNAACARSHWEDAITELTHAIAEAERARERALAARARCVQASAHYNRGELADAEQLLRAALRTAREYELADVEVPAVISLGILALTRGELDAAFAHLDDGVRRAERSEDVHWAAMGRAYLAIQTHLSGRTQAAEQLYDANIAELDTLGVRRTAGLARLARATLHMARGTWDRARAVLEQEAMVALTATCPDYEPLLQAVLAVCDLAEGQAHGYRHRLAFARGMLDHDPWNARSRAVVARVARLDTSSHEETHRASAQEASPAPQAIELALIEAACAYLDTDALGASLVVHREGKVFRVPGTVTIVDLSRRRPLRSLLTRLVEEHERAPARSVDDAVLIAHVWAGERIVEKAALQRLHTAISTLRSYGLRAFLERVDGGYRLLPDLVVKVVDDLADELLSAV